jgi:hypothetical protein
MAVPAGSDSTARIVFDRSSSLSAQVVAEVREALFAKRLRPGDFLGHRKGPGARASRTAIPGCSPKRWQCSSTSPE